VTGKGQPKVEVLGVLWVLWVQIRPAHSMAHPSSQGAGYLTRFQRSELMNSGKQLRHI
jgi:hypothetical protein